MEKYKNGPVSATFDFSEMDKLISNILDNLAPNMKDTLNREIADEQKRIEAAWPVKTGKSKEAFNSFIRLSGMNTNKITISAAIENNVPYVYYIKVDGKSSWNTIVKKNAKNKTQDLAKLLADDVKRLGGK